MYSQRDEENYIIPYFGGFTGTFLDIGAYHPFKFSNVRALYERGWSGAFIEPSRNLWKPFEDEYKGKFIQTSGIRIELHKIAIGAEDGKQIFYDSGGDAVSSFDLNQVKKWSSSPGDQYDNPLSYEVQVYTMDSFMEKTIFKTFDFISIDTEGMGLEILLQFTPDVIKRLDVKMICIEFDDKLAEISAYLTGLKFKKLHQTPENLIFVK